MAANPAVTTHLLGDFDENISNTDYTYIGNPLDLTARHHAVLIGRLLDSDSNAVKGTVTNIKDYTNPLSPGNPISQPSWPELWHSTIETADDGTFRWIVYPTTAPAREFAGEQETVTIRAEVGEASAELADVSVRRGQVRDLGDIVVS